MPLNHPHIAAIYGLEDVDRVRALVLELVEGETRDNAIYVVPFPRALAAVFRRLQVTSRSGGLMARRTTAAENRIMAVRNTTGPIGTWSSPQSVFEFPVSILDLLRNTTSVLAVGFSH